MYSLQVEKVAAAWVFCSDIHATALSVTSASYCAWTPGHWPAFGFDVNLTQIICMLVFFQMVNLLLAKGANINAFDKKDRRALHWAAYMGKGSLRGEKGADTCDQRSRGPVAEHAGFLLGEPDFFPGSGPHWVKIWSTFLACVEHSG